MTKYQGGAALLDSERIIKNKGTIHCHKHGLSQLNFSNNDGYCALFIVNTPAVDDSGVAHAVEHFVFRRSKAFDDPSSLFQLTALTDLSINASTMSNVSYFHCQSRCQLTFDLGLRYLLNGLLAPAFLKDDLPKEIYDGANCGVIYRELDGIYQGKSKKIQYQVGVSDVSDNRTHQHGGYCSTVGALTVDDLINYHSQHYRPEKITLVTANVDFGLVATLLNDIIPNSRSVEFGNCLGDKIGNGYDNGSSNNDYCPKVAQSISKYHPTKLLIRYWFSINFYYYFEHHYQALETLLLSKKAILVPLESNVNQAGLFALNIIVSNDISDELTLLLKQFVVDNPLSSPSLDKKKNNHQNPKYSQAINRLLDGYYTSIIQPIAAEPFSINTPTIHRLSVIDQINKSQSTSAFSELKPMSSSLILSLQNLTVSRNPSATKKLFNKKLSQTNKQHKIPLPQLLIPLYRQAIIYKYQESFFDNSLAVAFDANNCIAVIQVSQENTILAALSSYILGAYPLFLAPRIQGHCYLIGTRYLEQLQQLVIFSVLDFIPEQRLSAISHYLLQLSQDSQFIIDSLPLAKTKLINEYQLNSLDVENISSTALEIFLKELSISFTKASNLYLDIN